MIKKILLVVLPLLAGIGLAMISDKTLAGKLPGYDEPVNPGGNTKKLAWFIAIFAVGNILFHFISRKLKLKI